MLRLLLVLLFVVASVAADESRVTTSGPAEASATTEAPTETWTLRYAFQDQQSLRYETHQRMVMDARMGEERKVDVSELKQRRRFTVMSAEASGAARIAMQFESVWMQMQSGEQPAITFDSTMQPNEVPVVFRQAAHQLRGKAPKYWLSDRGLSLYPVANGSGSNHASASRSRPGAVPASASSAVGDEDRSIQLVEGVKLSSESKVPPAGQDPGSFLMPLPVTAVRIGDTWTETNTVRVRLTEEISREIPILQTYRLDSVSDGVAAISFWSSTEAPSLTVMIQSQLIQATPKGVLTFDINRGVMTRREMKYDATVAGAFGPESLLTSTGTNTETLLE